MFDFFKNIGRTKYPTWDNVPPPSDMEKIGEDMSKVVSFPGPSLLPSTPKAEAPPAKIFYRIGVTDSNRISFQMGHSEITMTKLGVRNLIDQLEMFQGQLSDEDNDNE
jgi:hypothetical protein